MGAQTCCAKALPLRWQSAQWASTAQKVQLSPQLAMLASSVHRTVRAITHFVSTARLASAAVASPPAQNAQAATCALRRLQTAQVQRPQKATTQRQATLRK